MKAVKHILTCGVIALVASSCASDQSGPSSLKAKTSSASSLASTSERGVAERVFSLVNNERDRAGKRVMRGHQGLNHLAQKHSNQHSRQMLQSWDFTGIGVSISGGTTYVTMCMGARFMNVPRSVRPVRW